MQPRLWFSFLSTIPHSLSAVSFRGSHSLRSSSAYTVSGDTQFCLRQTFVGRRDLSAASAVVLISSHDSASSECGLVPWFSLLAMQLSTTGGSSTHHCLREGAWAVRDLSATSVVVLISLNGSASSECGLVPWYSFLAIQF